MSKRDVVLAAVCLEVGFGTATVLARHDNAQWVRRSVYRAALDSLEMTRAQYAKDAQRWQLDREMLLRSAKGAAQRCATRDGGTDGR